VEHSNLDDFDVLMFSLSKKGYGSLAEVRNLDTDELLKIVEYENIVSDIEMLEMEDAK